MSHAVLVPESLPGSQAKEPRFWQLRTHPKTAPIRQEWGIGAESSVPRQLNFDALWKEALTIVEVTKALAALQPLYGKDNVEITTTDGQRVRGIVRSMKTTQALTTPSVKMECPNGEIVKISFPSIAEIKDLNPAAKSLAESAGP